MLKVERISGKQFYQKRGKIKIRLRQLIVLPRARVREHVPFAMCINVRLVFAE